MSRRPLACTAAAGVTIVALALLVPSMSGVGPEMDEGAVAAYADQVLDGAVPHRDFLTFYGPANLWVVAGAFAVFGSSVTIERAVGLVYRIVIVLSLFAIAMRLGGVLGGVLAGVVSAKMLAFELIWAYATYGAIAFGLLGVALATYGAESDGRRQRLLYLGAGLAGGVAVLMRFEITLAVLLSALPLLAYVSARSRIWYTAGFVATAGLYLPHFAIVGRERTGRLIGDLIATRPGRSLPLPDIDDKNAWLLAAGVACSVACVALGGYFWSRHPQDAVGRVLVAVGVLAIGLLPSVFFRPDSHHIRPFAFIGLSLLPSVALLVTSRARLLGVHGRQAVAIVVACAALYPTLIDGRMSLRLVREGRGLWAGTKDFYTDERGEAGRAVLARTSRLARPGESLFVGPQDLRRTNYGPTFMYFLLPQLRPASYYMEMNPGTANREGSGLADDLRRADWLILTTAWEVWEEPNESRLYGPSEPNEVVRHRFCVRYEARPYRLYERCDRSRSDE